MGLTTGVYRKRNKLIWELERGTSLKGKKVSKDSSTRTDRRYALNTTYYTSLVLPYMTRGLLPPLGNLQLMTYLRSNQFTLISTHIIIQLILEIFEWDSCPNNP